MGKNIDDFRNWLKTTESGTQYSDLWNEMKLSFHDNRRTRGYSFNKEKDYRKLIKFLVFTKKFEKVVDRLQLKFWNALRKFISFILTGDAYTAKRYSLHYGVDIVGLAQKKLPKFFEEYTKFLNEHKEFYSYSGCRIFYYYTKITHLIDIRKKHHILEIGAGLAGLCSIIARKEVRFSYVIIDIPEIIPNAYNELKSLCPNLTLFLPHQLKEFNECEAEQKVIWLLPSQKGKLSDIQFDLFINSESFAEMLPEVSQDYWDFVNERLHTGGHAVSINRVSRFVSDNAMSYEKMSSPFKLRSEKLILESREIDQFRALFPNFEETPNLIDIYVKKQSKEEAGQ